jgi:hypothetical protein
VRRVWFKRQKLRAVLTILLRDFCDHLTIPGSNRESLAV